MTITSNQPQFLTSKYQCNITSSLKLLVQVVWPDGSRDSAEEVLADASEAHAIFAENEQDAEDRLRRLLQRRRKKSPVIIPLATAKPEGK
jgi:hypothetical protein